MYAHSHWTDIICEKKTEKLQHIIQEEKRADRKRHRKNKKGYTDNEVLKTRHKGRKSDFGVKKYKVLNEN